MEMTAVIIAPAAVNSNFLLCSRDVSVGRERNPIACVNAVDDEPHPSDYLYIDHNVETQDLHINNVITSLQVCGKGGNSLLFVL